MNRRHWFGAVVACLVGFWTARRAPAGPARGAPRTAAPVQSLAVSTDGDGQVMIYTYDAVGRQTGVGGAYATTFAYDAGPGPAALDK
jgi:hypothetical protein